MSVGLNELKAKYNKVLEREKQAEKYISNCTDEQFKKWNNEFLKIVVELSKMMKRYEVLTGKEMTQEECLKGFKDVK